MKRCNLCKRRRKNLIEVLWWIDKSSYLCKFCMRLISEIGG